MQLRRPFALLAAAAFVAAAPASASAGDYVVRPAHTYSAGAWNIAPSTSLVHDVLADPVSAPTVPGLTSGYLFATGSETITSEVGLGATGVPDGSTVTGAKLKTYIATGSKRSIAFELRSGSSTLAIGWVPEGQPAAWRETLLLVKPTVAQLSDLRMKLYYGGDGASTESRVYAAYAVIAATPPATSDSGDTGTADPAGEPTATPTTGGAGEDAEASTDGVTVALPPAIALPKTTLRAAAGGIVAVPLTCQLAAGCTGTVSIRLVTTDATQSRRRKASRPKPKRAKRFRLKAGQSKAIPVRLDRRTKRLMRRKRRAKVAVTIAVNGSAPVTRQITVVQRRSAGRRR